MLSCMRLMLCIYGVVVLPLSSIQHFIWPVSWCLLADICNHTWIPECGHDEMEDRYRTFTDECDMFEFNCDNEKDYEWINYSECFSVRTCPTAPPCPTRRPCRAQSSKMPGLRGGFDMDDEMMQFYPGRRGRRVVSLGLTLPERMLKGKRRYTPEKWRKRAHTEPFAKVTKKACGSCTDKPAKFTEHTVVVKTQILKKETFFHKGKKMVKVIKSVAYKKGKGKPGKRALENKAKKKINMSKVFRRQNLVDSESDFLQ